jgi:hypothetical protein
MLRRIQRAAAELDPDQRLAGLAALALLVTLFLPWYQKSVAVAGRGLDSQNLTAFGVFTFVEAAIMLVALGVFALLFARGERRAFHLPGGDGTVILGAGAWAALLLLWRVFDRPDVEGVGATVGITWGFFFAFLAAAALAGAGWRIRQADRPEPPNPLAAENGSGPPRARRRPDPERPGARRRARRDRQGAVAREDDEPTAVWDDRAGTAVPGAGAPPDRSGGALTRRRTRAAEPVDPEASTEIVRRDDDTLPAPRDP